MYITKNKNKKKNKIANKYNSIEANKKLQKNYITKFDLSNNDFFKENDVIQTARDNTKAFMTIDQDYNDEFLLSLRRRFNDIFKKIKGSEKIFEEIEKRNKNKNTKVSNNVIKGAVYLKKLFFHENFPKKKIKRERKIDVNKVIEIQKIFKGFVARNINSNIDRVKVRQCLIELFCLLLYGHWHMAKIRYYFYILKDCYITAKLYAGDEITFVDRITFKLPKCFYSGTKINDLKSDRIGKDLKLE